MAKFERFEDIEAWQRARLLTREIYRVSSQGQFARDYGLKDQIRCASVAVMSNIAEGFEQNGNSEFVQFLSIAKASAGEVQAQLYVALDQGYVDEIEFQRISVLRTETSRMISGLIAHLRKSALRGAKYNKPNKAR